MSLTIGSLFSGVGGLELGLEWAGLGPVLWQVERDRFCRRVLARHWPDARRYDDVRTAPWGDMPRPDILCGGFPCQDLSQANPNGKGLAGARSGLWFEYLAAIEQVRPTVVVVENVPRLARRGLDTVVGGLCDLGFEVEGTRLRAEDVGAPQRRERLFLVAYANLRRREEQRQRGVLDHERPALRDDVARRDRAQLAHAKRAGCEGRRPGGELGGGGPEGETRGRGSRCRDRGARKTEPGLGGGSDGVSGLLDRQRWPMARGTGAQHLWEPDRTVATGLIEHRARRLRALGNAVVPHCAYVVGMRIRQRLAEPHATT